MRISEPLKTNRFDLCNTSDLPNEKNRVQLLPVDQTSYSYLFDTIKFKLFGNLYYSLSLTFKHSIIKSL